MTLSMLRTAAATATVAVALTLAGEPVALLGNGGFEQVATVPGLPATGGQHGNWTLRDSPRVPVAWELSSHFGGELTVFDQGACEGDRFLRVRAGAERQAHLHQACSELRPDCGYRVSIRYRGGPVEVKVYEYLPGGGAPRIDTVAAGPAMGDTAGDWHTLEAGYFMPPDALNVRFVAAVDTGRVGDIDDFRLETEPAPAGPDGGGWINARDHGASGSSFETTATTSAGSNQIAVADAGDFRVGQGVMISKCHPHYTSAVLRGPGSYYGQTLPLAGVAELRGFDGSAGDWLVFILDIEADQPLAFRWSDDLARTWKGKRVPIDWDWQPLSGGLEVKFLKRDLVPGHGVTFSARTQLVTRIERIEGNTFWLRDTPTRSVPGAVVRHCDAAALQTAIDRASKSRRHLYIPNGYYRLERGLTVRNAAIRIEGASGVHTVMDISDGTGAVFGLYGGREVTVRNLRMIGHTGLADKPGTLHNATGNPFWCCALKSCNAVSIANTERVLCENVHVSRMASEAFYCQGSSRTAPDTGPDVYTKSLTFLRCSVTDCAANAFNNNDTSENTSVLYCRIDGAGWHAYEGPGRFIRLIGNTVRNAGPFTVGDMNHRLESLTDLGCGQALVTDNVFEGCDGLNGGIVVNHGATQVTIANNLFVNYCGSAITVTGQTTRQSYPSRQAVVSGNIVDLTCVTGASRARSGIDIAASDTIVSGNQVFVRGDLDANVTGIRLGEPAVNLLVHDNLVRNCGHGIVMRSCRSSVTEVAEDGSFREGALPLEWPVGHRYRGWNLVWLSGAQANRLCTIADFDAQTCRFRLTPPSLPIRIGDAFSIFPPSANWTVHSNTLVDCRRPLTLAGFGSPTSVVRDNLIVRGQATGVEQALAVAGDYKLMRNHLSGFDEPGSGALVLLPCGVGRPLRLAILDNLFENCAQPVVEQAAGLWAAATRRGNLFLGCSAVPEQAAAATTDPAEAPAAVVAAAAPRQTRIEAGWSTEPPAVDGAVDEWPWADATRVAVLRYSPQGDELLDPRGRFCAAWDTENLFLAMRFVTPKTVRLKAGLNWAGDGVEVSLRGLSTDGVTPIFVLWGTVDGTFHGSTAMGTSAEQVRHLEQGARYAARIGADEWTCEWQVPFAALGLTAAPARGFKLNLGLRTLADDTWSAWVATGGRICEVDVAGELHLAK